MNTWTFSLALAAMLFTAAIQAADDAAASTAQPAAAASSARPAVSAPVGSTRAVLAELSVGLQPVTYAEDAKAPADLRSDCKLEEALEADIGKMLHHYHLGGRKATSTKGRTLKIQIVDVSGEGGGAWSGPKSLTVHVQLQNDGHLERETDMTRVNVGANPFRGTCHVLRQHTKRLGKDVASWLKDERFTPADAPYDDEPMKDD